MNFSVLSFIGALAVYGFSALAPPFADADPPEVVDLPSEQKARALAVIYSGDGGWQDLDKTIGEWMAEQDIHVVGVSTLEAFWESREPETVAADLEKILADGDPTGALPVLVIGYSFGANVFPFAWPHLSPATQERIRLVALLAPERETAFHVSVVGWLGVETGNHAVTPTIAALPRERVLCVYGSEEEDSTPCTDSSVAGLEILRTPGGHHFDGDYVGLGRKILDAFDRRA